MQKRLIGNFAGLILLMLWAGGCKSPLAHTDQSFEGACWALSDTLSLEFENSEPGKSVKIVAPVTFNQDYPFNNLYLRMEAIAPSGTKSVLPYEYQLMSVTGEWYGDISGDRAKFDLPLSQDQVFPENGTYRFRIFHFMQTDDLCGVESAGISVLTSE
ncbi:MAG: gliding motility lipoprotein GldH [Bacteroidia bacterium]|nr:gliding motility lipoprotein GldH [Bacteroidia bacterium]